MSKAKALGFSPERLQQIDRFLQDYYVGAGHVPCAQFVLTRRGQVVHQVLLGHRDLERQAPLTEDTVYRIYSMTKPVTSVALMMLVEEGRIALDDPAHRYIPAWKDLGVFAGGSIDVGFATTPTARPMQVVDLLRHTAGLTYDIQNRTNVDAAYRKLKTNDAYLGHDLEGFIGMLATLPLEFTPGEAWNYSVATDVVGHLVEKISGQRLDAFFQERIFDPLQMTNTGFQVREDQRGRFGACYAPSRTGGLTLQDDPQTSNYLRAPNMLAGGQGLVSTAADYLRFTQMLLNGGELDGVRLLAPRTVQLMTANHLPGGADLMSLSRSLFSESTNAGVGFGLGFAVVTDPARTLLPGSKGEFYWGGAAGTAFWCDPVEELSAVFMTQLLFGNSAPLRRALRTLTYSALMEPNA